MHSSLDQLASDAEGDEIFVHAHIYRHTPTANLFHKAFTQFEGEKYFCIACHPSGRGFKNNLYFGANTLISGVFHTFLPVF